MTSLEEIEQAITHLLDARATDPLAVAFDQALGTLYTARAIERLEATIRAIGVLIQRNFEDAHFNKPANQHVRTWQEPHPFSPFEIPGDRCRCGNPRVHPVHPAELP